MKYNKLNKTDPMCILGIHNFKDKGNQYFEILVCEHCGYKGKTRAKMMNEEDKK